MKKNRFFLIQLFLILSIVSCAKDIEKPAENTTPINEIPNMKLVWSEEFNVDGKPNSEFWSYENGFVRNEELQWYQSENANCSGGLLVIEGRREKIANPNYVPGSGNWKTSREFANYTSASINTRGLKDWLYGRFEIKARIDTTLGSWPAIWTLGTTNQWPSNGEIDIMEFYRVKGAPSVLANVAWGTAQAWVAKWHTEIIPFSRFTAKDADWVKKFHVWRMDWTSEYIKLYIDDELYNTTLLTQTINADGSNPFKKPQYLLLNLALGGNGGDPKGSNFPIKYEVDYVRVFQDK
jgi:beta-glucanase (GH16 family)